MKTLDNCTNMFGKISPAIQKRIKNYIKNPSTETWEDIFCIIINGEKLTTIWQAVLAEDPSFPRTGRSKDLKGNTIKDWPRIPDTFLLLKAIKNNQ